MNPFRLTAAELCSSFGRLVFCHGRNETLSGAFEINEKAKIKVELPRALGTRSASLRLFNESLGFIKEISTSSYTFTDINDIYEFKLDISEIGVGLYFFIPVIETVSGIVYGKKDCDSLAFCENNESGEHFQLSISDFLYNPPEKAYGGVIYHVFVDRFNKGGSFKTREGTYLLENWDDEIPEYPQYPGAPLKNNYFYGGTLWGISDKLSYIKSLGVNIIYLSPIFEAASNHKYDTADYMTVDEAFGGEEALKHLIKKAKSYGIGIVLDGVFNHTGADSIYFNKFSTYDSLGAYQSKQSQYYPWFDFQNHPSEYTCWWGIKILPRINPSVSQCASYFVDEGGVIDKYSSLGILGFRLDVVDELDDSFVEKIKERLNCRNKGSILYGEVWEDGSNKIAYEKRKRYYLGKELDGVMNYPIRTGLIEYVRDGKTDSLRYALTDIINNAPKRIRDAQMNLLGTHDTDRIITVLGGESPEGKSNDYLFAKRMSDSEIELGRARLMRAYTALATVPGIPSVFYGDEAGLQGYHDPFNRRTYPWGKQDKELLSHYKKLGKLRKENEVYKNGEFSLLHLDSDLLVFARYLNGEAFVTIVNNSSAKMHIEFSSYAHNLFSMERSKGFFVDGGKSCVFKTSAKTEMQIN